MDFCDRIDRGSPPAGHVVSDMDAIDRMRMRTAYMHSQEALVAAANDHVGAIPGHFGLIPIGFELRDDFLESHLLSSALCTPGPERRDNLGMGVVDHTHAMRATDRLYSTETAPISPAIIPI